MAATIIPAALHSGWPAAASRAGVVLGETDEFSYNIVKDPVHVRDFQATILHQFGIDHDRFTLQISGPRPEAHRRRPLPRHQRHCELTRAANEAHVRFEGYFSVLRFCDSAGSLRPSIGKVDPVFARIVIDDEASEVRTFLFHVVSLCIASVVTGSDCLGFLALCEACKLLILVAVRVGFEPTEPAKGQRFSRPPDSTTLAPHRF